MWGCSLVRFKAVACRAKDREYLRKPLRVYKSHHPRVALWTNRQVAVPLKHGEAGATPVKASKCRDGVTATSQSPKLLF